MPASIEVTLHQTPGGPVVGPVTLNSSRDDLRQGYQVVVRSFFAAASYNWTLAFTPYSVGPTSVDPNNYNRVASAATFLPPEGDDQQTAKFNIDWEGAYLVRLVIDAGLPTKNVQFVRLRELTKFGKIKLVSAGERRDQTGIIPVDATADGWADDQNQNLQRLTTLVRRMSTSGRVLYVDANRGRDNLAGQNDPNNIIRIPGTDAGLLDETGIRIAAEGFADFSSINDAITYADAAASRGEPAPSSSNPYWIVIRAGFYEENLVLRPHIHLCSPEPLGAGGAIILGAGGLILNAVHIRTTSAVDAHHEFVTPGHFVNNFVILKGIELENSGGTTFPVLRQSGGGIFCINSNIVQYGASPTQGPAIHLENSPFFTAILVQDATVDNWSNFAVPTNYAIIVDAPQAVVAGIGAHIAGSSGILVNPQPASSAQLNFEKSTFPVACTTGLAIKGFPSDVLFEFCSFANGDQFTQPAIEISAPLGSCNFDVNWKFFDSIILGHLIIEAGATTGTSELVVSGSVHNEVIFPTAPANQPNVYHAGENASSNKYINAYHKPEAGPLAPCPIPPANRLAAANVQDAIDELVLGTATWAYEHFTGPGTFAISNLTRLVGVDTTGGPVVLLLPATATLVQGRALTIKDESGTSAANPITVRPNPPNPAFLAPIVTPIDGARESVIDLNRMALMYYTDGTSWFVI